MDEAHDYLAKAQESLAGAESGLAHRRLNNCARRAYNACFQAAIAARLNKLCIGHKSGRPPLPPHPALSPMGARVTWAVMTLCKRASSAK
jgi:hypothetical protein